MKKILSVVLCAVCILSIMALNSFALETYFDEEPTAAPIIDGAINEGEYIWTSTALDKVVTFYNEFYVIEYHEDGQTITLEYLLSYDEDNIYLAIAERTTGYTSYGMIDLVFCTPDGIVDGEMTLEFKFVRNNEMTEAYEPTFDSFTVNGEDTLDSVSSYITDAKGYYFDDNVRNNNYVEFQLDRAAIESLIGADVAGFGMRILNTPGEGKVGMTVYGDEESVVYPDGLQPDIGYHFFGLVEGAIDDLTVSDETAPAETTPVADDPAETEPTETEPTETEPAETEILVDDKGCGASVSVIGAYLIACAAACVAFMKKRR